MTVRILTGDCRAVMRTLPADSVDCVVTSPPYWGLRDYGTAKWEGGDAACDHSPEKRGSRFSTPVSSKQSSNAGSGTASRRDCPCGAVRVDSQLGLEPTLGEHLAVMVDVFREVRRVMKPCATLWLNYGDCYATSVNGRSAADAKAAGNDDRTFRDKPFSTVQGTLKPKDLCMVPHRLAIALQDDGWWVRQDIVWSKPNPMPESVTDRCTKAHEFLFLLTKSARYYFDAEAIAENSASEQVEHNVRYAKEYDAHTANVARGSSQPGNVGNIGIHARARTDGKRNRRSVWTIATQPYSEAHFATFPPALVEPCILAGTSAHGVCGKCGAPWERQTDKTTEFRSAAGRTAAEVNSTGKWAGKQHGENIKLGPVVSTTTLGWSPSCECAAPVVPATVLDPFGGAGTVGLVADRLQRNAILVELNPAYADMARKRLTGDSPLFADVQAVA